MAKTGKTGRKLEYDQDVADRVCALVAEGEMSIREICDLDGIPTTTTIFKWLTREPSFADQYTHAREIQADVGFDKIAELQRKVETGKIDPNSARVAIDAIKWRIGKMKGKYSDNKHIHEVTATRVELTETERAARVASMLNLPKLVSGDSGKPES